MDKIMGIQVISSKEKCMGLENFKLRNLVTMVIFMRINSMEKESMNPKRSNLV